MWGHIYLLNLRVLSVSCNYRMCAWRGLIARCAFPVSFKMFLYFSFRQMICRLCTLESSSAVVSLWVKYRSGGMLCCMTPSSPSKYWVYFYLPIKINNKNHVRFFFPIGLCFAQKLHSLHHEPESLYFLGWHAKQSDSYTQKLLLPSKARCCSVKLKSSCWVQWAL